MALYKQIFDSPRDLFNNSFLQCQGTLSNGDVVKYKKRYDISSDGTVRCTIKYKTMQFGKNYCQDTTPNCAIKLGAKCHEIVDYNVDSKGYFPQSCRKRFREENVLCSRHVTKEHTKIVVLNTFMKNTMSVKVILIHFVFLFHVRKTIAVTILSIIKNTIYTKLK